MKTLIFVAFGLLGGCTVAATSTVLKACRVVEIAQAEADMAPAWYIEAGEVLAKCGRPDAMKEAEALACYAQKRNGYECKAK